MLFGTGGIDPISKRAPRVGSLDTEALTLPGVELLRVTFEIARRDVESFFPPALQVTRPPLVVWSVYRCKQGPLGPFCLAETQLTCRSGARSRTYLLGGVIDSEKAGTALSERWGFDSRIGAVQLFQGFDRVDASAVVEGRTILEVSMRDPVPLGATAIHFATSMHPAHTPKGLRLLQLDAKYDVQRNERGRASVESFSAGDWNEPRVRPTLPIVATFSTVDITLEKLRFMGRPEVNAFEGTEPVG
jgi:hypothetical protein